VGPLHGADIAPVNRTNMSASGLARCADDVEVDILVKGKAAATLRKLGEDDTSDSDSATSLGVGGYDENDEDLHPDEDDLDRSANANAAYVSHSLLLEAFDILCESDRSD
jgi:hypothetical protein